jgi:putative ABC transport system ATP-binding protein
MHLLRSLNEDIGITVIIVTHDPDMAAYANKTIHFKDGVVDNIEINQSLREVEHKA